MIKNNKHLKSRLISTPLGDMQALADEKKLYSLKFTVQEKLSLPEGESAILDSIEKELAAYFKGNLKQFTTPIALVGTPFQCSVWEWLAKIPYSQTWSYADLAIAVGNPKAVRAVALANSKNNLAVIIPCHRVIYKNGKLGGYAGGLLQKEKLLAHETKFS